jgi:hypothetical protein
MNNDFGRMWEEVVVVYSEVKSQYFLVGLGKTTNNFSKDSQ